METERFVCVGCPKGCEITVQLRDGEIVSIEGFTCPTGEALARKEVTARERILTAVARAEGGIWPVVPVRTSRAIPLARFGDVLKEIKKVIVRSPVRAGDVVLRDVAGTGVDLIVERDY